MDTTVTEWILILEGELIVRSNLKIQITLEKKLNGGGSFNDYTLERFSKDLENNPIILVSGFIFPKGQRREGEYLRSAGFSFRDFLSRDLTKYFEGLKK